MHFIFLQPCLVISPDVLSNMVLAPHLQVACILCMPFCVLCTEPFRTTSFGGEETLFWL
jgi:hypothetical protein